MLKKVKNTKLDLDVQMLDRVHLYKYLGLMVDDHLNINKHNQDLHKIFSHKLFMLLCEAKRKRFLRQ